MLSRIHTKSLIFPSPSKGFRTFSAFIAYSCDDKKMNESLLKLLTVALRWGRLLGLSTERTLTYTVKGGDFFLSPPFHQLALWQWIRFVQPIDFLQIA